MWIGSNGNLVEFKDPATGINSTPVKWGAYGTLLNGGGWGKSSVGGHQEFTLNWPFLRGEQVAELLEILQTGDLLDVLVATSYEINALSYRVANPGSSCAESERVATPVEMQRQSNLPPFGRRFARLSRFRVGTLPTGKNTRFIWWGSGNVQFGSRSLLPGRVYEFGKETETYISIPAGTIVYGMRLVIDAPWENVYQFRQGMGHSGVRVKQDSFQVTHYSAPSAVDYNAVSVSFIETGDWENAYS